MCRSSPRTDFDEDFDESVDNGPTGGFTWDGRARNPHEQARLPLLSLPEMANARIEDVVAAVKALHRTQVSFARRSASTCSTMRPRYSTRSCDRWVAFEQSPSEFYPYPASTTQRCAIRPISRKQERRGSELFNDPAKGNWAHCHQSERGSSGAFLAFTDFGYVAMGAPRNRTVAVNADLTFYDLGSVRPLREDYRDRAEYCGLISHPVVAERDVEEDFLP